MYTVVSLDEFPIPAMIPLIERAVEAANQGNAFSEMIDVVDLEFPAYVRLVYSQPPVPSGIEIGTYHGGLLNNEVRRELETNPNLILNIHEPWAMLELIWQD